MFTKNIGKVSLTFLGGPQPPDPSQLLFNLVLYLSPPSLWLACSTQKHKPLRIKVYIQPDGAFKPSNHS